MKTGIIEPPQSMGELGHEGTLGLLRFLFCFLSMINTVRRLTAGCFLWVGWYVPLFTAEHDPSLLHYSGLVGEENREKLAKTFKKPLSWGHYCERVSPNNCSVADSVAARAPKDEYEYWRHFYQGLYTGHFMVRDQ